MMLGSMQDFPLRIMRLMDHAEREHGNREIVATRADGTTIRTNWTNLAHDARRMAQALERLGIRKGDRVATLAMNHDRHLAAWFGVVGTELTGTGSGKPHRRQTPDAAQSGRGTRYPFRYPFLTARSGFVRRIWRCRCPNRSHDSRNRFRNGV